MASIGGGRYGPGLPTADLTDGVWLNISRTSALHHFASESTQGRILGMRVCLVFVSAILSMMDTVELI